jgi:hypothetical protein
MALDLAALPEFGQEQTDAHSAPNCEIHRC